MPQSVAPALIYLKAARAAPTLLIDLYGRPSALGLHPETAACASNHTTRPGISISFLRARRLRMDQQRPMCSSFEFRSNDLDLPRTARLTDDLPQNFESTG